MDRPRDWGHVPPVLADQLAGLRLSKLTPAAVRGFRDRQLKAGRAPATVVKRMNLRQLIFQHAVAEWDVPLHLNPASGKAAKRPPGADQKRDRRLRAPSVQAVAAALAAGEEAPQHEFDQLIDAVNRSEWPDDVWLVSWSIERATRRDEAVALRWRDINFGAQTISLLRTKTMRHAKVKGPEIRPMMPGALALLREKLIGMSGSPGADDCVFNVGSKEAFVRFGRMMTRAGLIDLRLHDLRHEATCRLARLFPNPMDLIRVTGHRDLKSLNRYYQPCMTQLANDAAERAAGIVGKLNGTAGRQKRSRRPSALAPAAPCSYFKRSPPLPGGK